MDINELKVKARKMLATFVNEIGLDGEYYASTCDCPMIWGEPKTDGLRRIYYSTITKNGRIVGREKAG